MGRSNVDFTQRGHQAATIWPLGHVPYSQMTVRNPGSRTDCSGYVSMCLDLPRPGLTTVTLVEDGNIHEITPDELRPGDLVGHCGAGTGGDAGHVIVFDHWHQGHVTYWAYEFHGGPQLGPEHSLIHYPYHGLDGYRAYRYKEIDGAPDTPGGHWATVTHGPTRCPLSAASPRTPGSPTGTRCGMTRTTPACAPTGPHPITSSPATPSGSRHRNT
jgi:hypothetical protein